MMIVMITLTILASLIITTRAIAAAWRFHTRAIHNALDLRDQAINGGHQLAEEVIAARHARDHYRGALHEILRVTTPDEAAHVIANRFLNRTER